MIASGIDLAGVQSRPTGFCVVDARSMHVKTRLLFIDIDVLKAVKESKLAAAAIGAGLFIPRGRRSLEQRGSVHLRECDGELLRRGIRFLHPSIYVGYVTTQV